MRRQPPLTLTFLLVAFLPASVGAQSKSASKPQAEPVRAESLEAQRVPLRTIDPRDENFADLMPLIEKIGDARVVVLGEATHSEGTSYHVKARIVRFLHREMGFEVLAWESGLVQCHGLNSALRSPEIPLEQAKAYLMSGGWAAAEGCDAVFSYARESWKTERPLLMAGFDTGRPHYASPYFRKFVQGVTDRAPELSMTADQWDRIDQMTKWSYGFLGQAPPPAEALAAARRDLTQLRSRLKEHHDRAPDAISQEDWLLVDRFVANALAESSMKELPPDQRNPARDRAMAENLIWLFEELYPGRKVIVWAATAHFIRNSDRIINPQHPDWYDQAWEAGNHLAPVLKDDLYTIAVTSYRGEIGDVFPEGSAFPTSTRQIEPAPAGSFEAAAHQLEEDMFFIDLRRLPAEHRLNLPFVSVCLGRNANIAPWAEVIDALLFIDEAKPVKYLK